MHFDKITKPQRTYQEVLKQICNQIHEGKLRPGVRLRGEREMAAEMGVSRTTLREALRTLELIGWVEIKPGGGTFIRDAQSSGIIDSLAFTLKVVPVEIDEIWETRVTLEVECAGLAAQRATEEDLKEIEQAIFVMQAKVEDLDAYAKADTRFHYLVARSAKNSMMSRLLQTFVDQILELIKTVGPIRFSHDIGGFSTINEHISIYEAIQCHDIDRARVLMRSHLEKSRVEMS